MQMPPSMDIFWTHMSPCKFPKSLEMGNFGVESAVQGSAGNARRGVIGEGCGRSTRVLEYSLPGKAIWDRHERIQAQKKP